jgi:hypothetical protein
LDGCRSGPVAVGWWSPVTPHEERDAAAQELQEALRARGVDQDDELQAAIVRFVDAFAAAFPFVPEPGWGGRR